MNSSIASDSYTASNSDRLLRLLVYHFDLLLDHLTGESVDRDVNPVALFPFDDEVRQICGSCCRWRIPPALRDYINHQIPRTRLASFSECAHNRLAVSLGSSRT